jgi:hypothetical protein
MVNPPKYPHTPHWPQSEKVHRDDTYHSEPTFFLGKEVVITEKLDGGNTCLSHGKVYARSVAAPTTDSWFAMVKKHHAWKTNDAWFSNTAIYGEDLYGIHTLKYYPLAENKTFYVFAMRNSPYVIQKKEDIFYSWDTVVSYSHQLIAPTVPVVYRGTFESVTEITEFFRDNLRTPSALGPEKEGFVMRIVDDFPAESFSKCICKYVRKNHVQTDEHWRRNWKPCELKKDE